MNNSQKGITEIGPTMSRDHVNFCSGPLLCISFTFSASCSSFPSHAYSLCCAAHGLHVRPIAFRRRATPIPILLCTFICSLVFIDDLSLFDKPSDPAGISESQLTQRAVKVNIHIIYLPLHFTLAILRTVRCAAATTAHCRPPPSKSKSKISKIKLVLWTVVFCICGAQRFVPFCYGSVLGVSLDGVLLVGRRTAAGFFGCCAVSVWAFDRFAK